MNRLRIFILLIVVLFLVLWIGSQFSRATKERKTERLTYSQFREMLTSSGRKKTGTLYTRALPKAKQAPSSFPFEKQKTSITLEISPRQIKGRYLKPGNRIDPSDDLQRILERTIPFVIENLPGTISNELLQKLEKNGISYRFVNEEGKGFFSTFASFLPIMLIVFLLWMLMMRQLQAGGSRVLSFGKSKAKLLDDSKKKTTFQDVAGCDEAKQELREIVEFLKGPQKFRDIGAKIPRGVLLIGPPGTGKTLLARSVAGEASVPFYSISGSDFVEMFVGVGASRVRDLFDQAKKNSPCIIFVDEIDAVGRLRGAGLGGGHDEREQTLNQMLVEMDGFSENEGTIVIAATNRPDVLDPALLRPGRFDRQVAVDVPDMKGRQAVLQIHTKKVKVNANINLKKISQGTPGFTGADLANLVNEAALLAARRSKKKVSMEDMEEAKDKVMMGPERKSFLISPKEKEVIAYHEGGHALLTSLLPYAEPVHKVTIIPRGSALGLTQSLPEEERRIQTKSYWEDRICVLMGGYLAEKIIFKDTSTGASNDIQVATKIARRMVCEWGMSNAVGTVSYVNENENVFLGREMSNIRHYSDVTASSIDEEIKRIVQSQLEKGRSLLTEHRSKLEKIAKTLLEKESINGQELESIVHPEKKDPTKNQATQATKKDKEDLGFINTSPVDNTKSKPPKKITGNISPSPSPAG